MAGLFGLFDYTKPGRGVPKNAPAKPWPSVFLGVLGRKFWHLIRVNLLYVLFNLPGIAMAYVGVSFLLPEAIFADGGQGAEMAVRIMAMTFFMCVPVACVGPAQAGFAFVLRNYARESHAFIWSDFAEHARKNLKQSLAACALSLAAFMVFGVAVNFYWQLTPGGIWAAAALGVTCLAFTVFLGMHLYIYPMMVTYRLPLLAMLKNALIFSLVKFFQNLGVLVIVAALNIAATYFWHVGVLLYIFILPAAIGLFTSFYSQQAFKKYMQADGTDIQKDSQRA